MQQPEQQNILLVDDHPENLLALESILEQPGLHFVRAASGEEALHLLLNHEIALILLDVHMPGLDGGIMLRRLPRRSWTRSGSRRRDAASGLRLSSRSSGLPN